MRHLAALLPVLLATLVGAPPAAAWTWPADGPVLQPFRFGDDPYAAGLHRGVDLGGPDGAPVRAPTSGVVSFAGSVPGNGRTVAIRTGDGLSVTLLHLGTVGVRAGAAVDEGAAVGTLGRSGDAEHPVPSVHLGIRVLADPHGYLDPLELLPGREVEAPAPAPAAACGAGGASRRGACSTRRAGSGGCRARSAGERGGRAPYAAARAARRRGRARPRR